jgi:hypothetical protein
MVTNPSPSEFLDRQPVWVQFVVVVILGWLWIALLTTPILWAAGAFHG